MTIRSDIDKERILRRQRKASRVYKADGLRAVEVKAKRVIYCATCKGPVVDTPRARDLHAEAKPKCREAIIQKEQP